MKRINFLSFFRVSWFLVFMILVFLFASAFFFKGSVNYEPITLFFILTPIVLSLYLLIEYYLIDKNKTILINENDIIITEKTKTEINFLDIKAIIFFIPSSIKRNSQIKFLPTEYFYFMKITTTQSEIFYITSLLYINIYEDITRNKLLSSKTSIKTSFFNSILMNKLD